MFTKWTASLGTKCLISQFRIESLGASPSYVYAIISGVYPSHISPYALSSSPCENCYTSIYHRIYHHLPPYFITVFTTKSLLCESAVDLHNAQSTNYLHTTEINYTPQQFYPEKAAPCTHRQRWAELEWTSPVSCWSGSRRVRSRFSGCGWCPASRWRCPGCGPSRTAGRWCRCSARRSECAGPTDESTTPAADSSRQQRRYTAFYCHWLKPSKRQSKQNWVRYRTGGFRLRRIDWCYQNFRTLLQNWDIHSKNLASPPDSMICQCSFLRFSWF